MQTSKLLTLAATATAITLSLSFITSAAAPIEFIRSSCKVTRYPDLCEKCLINYTPAIQRPSPRQLAHAALKVSTDRAFAASAFVHRMSANPNSSAARRTRDGGALRDCVETIDDSLDRLQRSVKEMEHMGRYGSISFRWHLSNVQTWVSAALTDQSTCLDGLSQDKSAAKAAKVEIHRRIVHVTRLTSNALALINRLDPSN